MISLTNGQHGYLDAHAPTLVQCSLEVATGQVLALMGPSGCGKSTLLRCFNALETLNSGQLIVNGIQLPTHQAPQTTVNLSQFRASVGMVFQQYNLFPHMTVLQNCLLAPTKVLKQPKTKIQATVMALLQQVGLANKTNVYPDALSGGQQQRVALVRSLVMEPKILLLDEPTSALDPMMAKEVWLVIADLLQSRQANNPLTVVMVSHAWKFVSTIADTVAFMHGGSIVECATPEQLLTHGGVHASTQAFLQAV
jgi:ABC-type polar amino acid transport system ATPase subunit